MYLAHLERTGDAPTTLKLIQIGGSAMPPTMAQTLKTRYNVDVLHAWGMTELCPLGVASTPTPAIAELGTEEMQDILWTRQGRLLFGVELKIVDEEGASLPWAGITPGVLKARGTWAIERYFSVEHSARRGEECTDGTEWED